MTDGGTTPDRAASLHAVPELAASADRFRLLIAALDLGYALVRLVRTDDGTPVDYLVVEHNDAMERQLGISGAGELASVLTPGFDPAWAVGFARVAETGVSERVERYEPAVGRWLDVLAVRVGDDPDPLVAVVFRDMTARHRHAELLQAGRERHAFLLRLSDALRPLESPLEVMETAARMLAEELAAERVFYALVEPEGEAAVTRVEVVGSTAERGPALRIPLAALGEPLLAALAARTTLVTSDIATDPRVAGLGLADIPIFQGGAAIGVPLVSDGRWQGILGVRATDNRTWSATDVELVEETAERAWSSVVRAQTSQALAATRSDLDEQRELALEQERAARRQAEAATRMRDEFLARVSHELRTPLAVILLWSRLLASGRAAGHEAEAFDVIERSAEAQRVLVDDLLDASRALAGTLSISPSQQPLAPVVRTAVDSMRPIADARGVVLLDSLAPVEVSIDRARIGQVLRNLLDNAIRHTPAGGTVRVVASPSGRSAVVAVADTGDGIDQDLLPHVFERFLSRPGPAVRPGSADDGTSVLPAGGLGMGLAISRELVALHRGTLVAHSDGPGKGATFTMRLPAGDRAPGGRPRRVRIRHRP